MDQVTRQEFDKLHERVSDLKGRVINLEAQQPHISSTLVRIEKSVEKLNGHLVRAIWLVATLFIAAVVKFTLDGGWSM